MLGYTIFMKFSKLFGRKSIYLDWASSASPNPGTFHSMGLLAKNNLDESRKQVASVLRARENEIIFTSTGTEANNMAVLGVLGQGEVIPHIISTNIEHPSVLEALKYAERSNLAEVTLVPVEPDGIVDVKKIKDAIKENTRLISVMYANNEIGTIQPIREIAKMLRHYKKHADREDIYLHTDAVQAVNYLDLDVLKLGVDMLTLSGAKVVRGLGAGVLFKRKGVSVKPLVYGGGQEHGLRPGTENLISIRFFAKALYKAQHEREESADYAKSLQEYFVDKLNESEILKRFNFKINGSTSVRLPNNVNITIPNIESELLVIELDAFGIMVSSKSACKSAEEGGSYVIKAINPDLPDNIGGVRFSFGVDTSKKDLDHVVDSLEKILSKLEKWYNSKNG